MNHLRKNRTPLATSLLGCALAFSACSAVQAQDQALFELSRDSVRMLPFDVMLNKLTHITAKPKTDPIFAELLDSKLQLGGFNHAEGIRPDDGVTPIKVSLWAEAMKPVCQSSDIVERFPNLASDPSRLLESAYGRRAEPGDLEAFNSAQGIDLPARIEAEHYDEAVDTTPGLGFASEPTQCAYRGMDVDVENSSEAGCNIGQAGEGESVGHYIAAAGGTYDVVLRLATQVNTARVSLLVNGESVGTINVANDGWQNYSDYEVANVAIPSGAVITVAFDTNYTNYNYMYILEAGSTDRENVNLSDDSVGLSTAQRSFVNCMTVLNSAEFKSF